MSHTILHYFQDIFSASSVNTTGIVDCVRLVISEDFNFRLMGCVEAEEVWNDVFQMHPDNSPGPDGFNSVFFFQKYWDLVGSEVTIFVQNFFLTGVLPQGLNDTHLVLISKKSKPKTMQDLRPIALCNVLYKIASKVLANRLHPVLSSIICDSQSAFLPGRLISNNIIIFFF